MAGTKALPPRALAIANPLGGPGVLVADFSSQRTGLLLRNIGVDPLYIGMDPQAGATYPGPVFQLDPGERWSPDSAAGSHQGQIFAWGSYAVGQAVTRSDGFVLHPAPGGLIEVHELALDPSAPNPEQTGLALPQEATAAPAEPPTPWQPAPAPKPFFDITRRL